MCLCGLGQLEKCQPVHFRYVAQLNASPMCLCGTFVFILPFVPVNGCTLSELDDPRLPVGTQGRLTDMSSSHPAENPRVWLLEVLQISRLKSISLWYYLRLTASVLRPIVKGLLHLIRRRTAVL